MLFNSIEFGIFLPIVFLRYWFGRENEYALEKLGLKWKKYLRWGFYFM
jgi:alginate O-acetyltransferase complex protein AlgI